MAFIVINAINTFSIQAGIRAAFIDIVLTVPAISAFETPTLVTIGQIFASPIVLARVTITLIDLAITEEAGKSMVALAPKIIVQINADTISARVLCTIVAIDLTTITIESRWAVTGVGSKIVSACSSIKARIVFTLVHVLLAIFPRESIRTCTPIAVDEVGTNSAIDARVGCAFISIIFTCTAVIS